MKEILLIEDFEDSAVLTQKELRHAGIANPIRHLRDGTTALAVLSYADQVQAVGPPPPSIILLDLKLPGLGGLEILAYLGSRPGFANTLKIVLSELRDTRSIKQAYALGAQSFLNKPVTQADMRNLIEAFPSYWILSSAVPDERPRSTPQTC